MKQQQQICWFNVCSFTFKDQSENFKMDLTKYLCVIGLGIYGDSNSESEEEQNEQEQLQNNDSDEELMVFLMNITS